MKVEIESLTVEGDKEMESILEILSHNVNIVVHRKTVDMPKSDKTFRQLLDEVSGLITPEQADAWVAKIRRDRDEDQG